MHIPLLNLKRQYNEIKPVIEPQIIAQLESGNYIMGDAVKSFEKSMEEYLEVKHVLTCANGTDALIITLKALGIGTGDEVITTPFTFFATAEAISFVGATPVFVDVDELTYNINPALIEAKITKKTKAIMPVHIFGVPADMDEINDIAKKHSLFVIEDACQAIGAIYKSKKIGTLSDVACFSFFPTKNLGAFGDGGMITTNNTELYTYIKGLRLHGSGNDGLMAYNSKHGENIELSSYGADHKYYNYIVGHNSRLDSIQAVILTEKLTFLDMWNERRDFISRRYCTEIKNQAIKMSSVKYERLSIQHVVHLFIIEVDHRDNFKYYMDSKGIDVGFYYPVPLHLQVVYKKLNYQIGDMPIAEMKSHVTVAIPCSSELTDIEVDYIIDSINQYEGIV